MTYKFRVTNPHNGKVGYFEYPADVFRGARVDVTLFGFHPGMLVELETTNPDRLTRWLVVLYPDQTPKQ